MIDLDKLKELYKFSKQISLADAHSLIKLAKMKTFEKNDVLLSEGSSRNEVFFVRKGLIRQYFINEKGEEITFRLIPENYILANSDVILFEQPSRFHYEAYERTKTFTLDYDKLQEVIARNPKLQANRIKFSQRLMMEMHRRIEMFVMHSAEERYLKFLEDYPDVANRVPDKYIANILGITPVSLSRIRARIANQ